MRSILLTTLAAAALSTAAFAQAPAPAKTTVMTAHTQGATTTKSKTTATGAKPRTAASLACSSQADSQKLTGKPRKTFMSSCKRTSAKAMKK